MRALLPAPQRGSSPPRDRVSKPEVGGIPSKISSACLACKERKTKCSGTHPCNKCHLKKTACHYDVSADARRKVNRAKQNELTGRQHDLLLRLLDTLRRGERDHIDHLVNLARADLTWDQLLSEVFKLQHQYDIPFSRNDFRFLQVNTDVPTNTTSGSSTLPKSESPDRPTISRVSSSTSGARLSEIPVFRTPDGPWTCVSSDDELLSHLISLYFVWEHPTLPFLDRELFLEDFDSRSDDFCSPLLVNAICALGSRYSNRPEICPPSMADGLKGQTFESEAYRLWELEKHRPCLTSVQALAMLAWRAAADGRDRKGRSLFRDAVALSHELRIHKVPPPAPSNGLSLGQRRLQRGQSVTAWALRNFSIIHSTAVMRPLIIGKTSAVRQFPTTDLYHGREWWRPYPMTDEDARPSQFWPTFDAWSSICFIASDIIARLYPDPSAPDADLTPEEPSIEEIQAYEHRIREVQSTFNKDLAAKGFSSSLPHVIQFRAWSTSYPLILYNTLTSETDRDSTHEHVFQLVSEITSLVREYRQKYSMECVHGIIMNPLVVVSYTLLSRLEDPRSQPLIEVCVEDMIEMARNNTVLKAVLHIYAMAARKANMQWSAASRIEANLARITPRRLDLSADWPILGPNSYLIEGGDDGAKGLSELMTEWDGMSIREQQDAAEETSDTSTPSVEKGKARVFDH